MTDIEDYDTCDEHETAYLRDSGCFDCTFEAGVHTLDVRVSQPGSPGTVTHAPQYELILPSRMPKPDLPMVARRQWPVSTHALVNPDGVIVQLGTSEAMESELARYYGRETWATVIEAGGAKVGDQT